MAPPPDDRSPLAIAADWATVAITVSLEMAAPSLIGYGLDFWLGTKPVLLIVGAIAGLVAGMSHLIRMAGKMASEQTRPDQRRDPSAKSRTSDNR